MRFAEVSVPNVPTASSQVLFHHLCIFPSDSHPFLLEDAHNKEAPTTSHRRRLRGWWCRNSIAHWSSRTDRRTGCRSRIVHGVVHDRRVWCRLLLARLPSLDFGNHVPHRLRREVSLSLRSDIRFRASCTEADDGVDTDVAHLAQLIHAPCWFAV